MSENTASVLQYDWRIEECNVCARRRGDLPTGWARGLCSSCRHKTRRSGTFEAFANPPIKISSGAFVREDARTGRKQPFYHPIGTVVTDQYGYTRIKTEDGWKAGHRHVMESHLGRLLEPGENVHHINGVRNDNRIENLELWYVPQTRGQRVEDLLHYMVSYHADALRAAMASTQ